MESTHELELTAGTVRYRDTGEGPVILFVHGLLVDGRLWDPVIARLRGTARCIVPDLPLGSHVTPMRPDADLTPRGVARLVGELIDRLGLEDVTLVGNDTGGAVCQLLIAERPDAAARLVLTPCDAFENFPPEMFRGLTRVARLPFGRALVQPLRWSRTHRLPMTFGWLTMEPLPRELTSAWARPALTDRAIWRDTAKLLVGIDPADTLAAAERLGRFTGPALVAWAGEDRFFPPGQGRRLAALFPHGRYVEVPGARTFLPLDQPERLAELIAEHVREPVPAG